MKDYLIVNNELTVVCAWCGKFLYRKPGRGQTGISCGICPECRKKYFPGVITQEDSAESKKLTR